MTIIYTIKNGTCYARVPGKSVRKGRKVVKVGDIYLGKVIDKNNNIFCTKAKGVYQFDPVTGETSTAPEQYLSETRPDNRRRERVILDFGDAYLIDALLEKIGYKTVLDSIPYQNRDTLYAMILYYTLSSNPNSGAEVWFRGSYASVLYPNANLTSQRISDFLRRLGDPGVQDNFFRAHIKWIRETICNDPAVILDSTGLPNEINFRLAAISNHNGEINRETRLLVPVQRDSGLPLMFRAIKGNIVDVSTARRAICELQENGIAPDMILMDAGYPSKDTIDDLFHAEIDFISRLPATTGLYTKIINDELAKLKNAKNIVQYGKRVLYITRIETKLWDHTVYAYLGCDINRYNDEVHKTLKRIASGKADVSQLAKKLDKAGLFVLFSSLPYETDGILPAYYSRQAVEQYFDVCKGSAKITPLRVHDEFAVYGHLLLSTIAATLHIFIQQKVDQIFDSNQLLFAALRNQKCLRYKTRISLEEPDADANLFYKKLKINPPLYFANKGEKYVPVYHIPRKEHEEIAV